MIGAAVHDPKRTSPFARRGPPSLGGAMRKLPLRFLSNPGIKFVLDAVRLTPVPESIDRVQLTHELLA
jgi:hypothetical protein